MDGRVDELLDQVAEHVVLGEFVGLLAEPEPADDLLYVGREPVEVGEEVGLELLRGAEEIHQRERRGVVERLPGGLTEYPILVHHVRPIELFLHLQDGVLTRLEEHVETADDDHRQDDVAVLAADVVVAEQSSAMPQMKLTI